MSKSVSVKNNQVDGDLVIGDKNQYLPSVSALEKAIQKIVASAEENPEICEIIEELNEYISDNPDRPIIGVEKKLTNGDRADLIEKAVAHKNKFERIIAKRQLSTIEQKVFLHILANIDTNFNQYIRPMIIEGRPKSDIDAVIHEKIIDPIYNAIVDFDHSITIAHVSGMLYFLTGRCHLVWEK